MLPVEPLLFAPSFNGSPLIIGGDPETAAAAIKPHSARDAERFGEFCVLAADLANFLGTLFSLPLPDRAAPGEPRPIELLKTAWKFHRLRKHRIHEFLRILPMSMADLLNE